MGGKLQEHRQSLPSEQSQVVSMMIMSKQRGAYFRLNGPHGIRTWTNVVASPLACPSNPSNFDSSLSLRGRS